MPAPKILQVDETKITPVDKKKMGGLFLATVADQFSQLVIMPFLPPLCEIFFPEADDVGVYVGIMQSLFYFVQFFAAPYWGKRADTIGRRPIFLMGLVGVILGMLLIGFGQSFLVICLSRMVAAGLCVTPVVAKTYIGEITDHTNQHRGFAVIGVAVGLTTFIAPLIGGYLSEPADQIGGSYDTDFWREFPYLLPCLVACGFAVVALIYVFLFIPETDSFLQSKAEKEAITRQLKESSGDMELAQQAAESKQAMDDYAAKAEAVSMAEQEAMIASRGETVINLYFLNAHFPPIARTRTVGLAIAVFTFHAMITIIFDTMFPVFCEAPYENNGLNLSVEDTGVLLSVKGVAAIVYQSTIYPKIGGNFGARTAIIWVLLAWMPILIMFPLTSSMAYSWGESWAWAFMIFLQMFRAVVASTGAMALMMIINNSVPSSVLGQINGTSTSCSSAARCIGPLWSGVMWTGSVTSAYWRLSGCVMYWCLAVLNLGAIYVAFKMPFAINMPMGKKKRGMLGKSKPVPLANLEVKAEERDY